MANRIFIKLLVGFWLCSSLTLGAVALLPLIQKKHDQAPLPTNLQKILVKAGKRLQNNPSLLKPENLRRISKLKRFNPRFVLFIANEEGRILNRRHFSKDLRRFILMADDAQKPIRHQFRERIFFGPYQFKVQDKTYSLYGSMENRHPRPWFFWFTEYKLLTLSLAILLSGLLCSVLAWHLGRPLKQLKRSADNLAKGELSSRVDSATLNRSDEIGQLARAFNSMANAIEQMVNQQQRLIGDVSHELRTPLTRLQLALAVAHKKGQQTKETERIGYEAEQLEALIQELLTLSRVSNQTMHQKQRLSLGHCLEQVISDVEFEAEQQQKQFTVEIDSELNIEVEATLLCRAVENILRNALRYAETAISICSTQDEDTLLLIIEDDGCGIEQSELENIFKPFYRPDSARDRNSGGCGLGLAISQAAIAAHQGHITAENIQPHGLRVTISLPN
ncbi:ATP-binding protein [Parashewanella tropica]|uniref:ATP-binding protein n=1 Tax=Parashewanella tropica TaxID=2547970 RepID=UPI001059510C|nr:ATP-binding protein [Parashewanella tropica]